MLKCFELVILLNDHIEKFRKCFSIWKMIKEYILIKVFCIFILKPLKKIKNKQKTYFVQ